ncbi:MAG: hypothetical protein H8E66_29085 [Planctomycetes bacterium]|nr:hypothetical protein [Planctomycetota bacterium]
MQRTLYLTVAFSLVAASFGNFVQAETTAELVRAAKGKAQAIGSEDVAGAKSRLLVDVQSLEAFLATNSDEQATAWRELVHLDAMQAELEKEAPSLQVLNRSLVSYLEDEDGLETKSFTDVRRSLREYMNKVFFSSAEGFAEQYDRRIDELASLLEAYEAEPSTEQAIEIGRAVGWFERAGQIGTVTTSIRERHSHPNLHVVASKQLLASTVRDTVDATEPLNECILGTSIRGTSHLTGNVDLELVPSDENAAFDITLAGDAVSDNVGYNRGVSIYSTGYTNVNASKRVYFDVEGVTSDAATATASTSTNVSSIAAKCRLIRKMAWKQVYKKKSQAERIASSRAASRVAGRVDGQAHETLAETDESFQDKFRAPLVRRNSFPELFDLKTTNTQLFARLLRAGRSQLAAPGPAPELEGDYDLGARVHESIAGNFSESMLGGVMLTDERIVEMYQEGGVEVPEDLAITIDSDPWAITFSRSQPIRVEFANGGVKVSVLCQSLHQGEEYAAVPLNLKDEKTDKLYRSEIRISRAYDLTTPNDGGLQLVAKGDLSIEFIDNEGEPVEKYGARHAGAVGFLSKKFNAMLKPKLPEEAGDGIALNDRWARIGKLKARVANAADGWLSIGWEQILPPTPVVNAVADESDTEESGVGDVALEDADSEPITKLVQTASIAP